MFERVLMSRYISLLGFLMYVLKFMSVKTIPSDDLKQNYGPFTGRAGELKAIRVLFLGLQVSFILWGTPHKRQDVTLHP